MLSVQNLSFSYGAIQALDDITMVAPASRITCILGRNGVGKTTLLMNIMGLLRPTIGAVFMEDRDVTDLPADKHAAAGFGLVPQGRRIFARLTVEENLRVGLASAGRKAKIPDEVYELFPILKTMSRRMGGDLSGGQQQQLAIARALVAEPRILLLDEPTEGIQPNVIQQIGEVLKRLVVERGLTIVMVEQYLDFVKEIGDRFYLMDRRRVVAEGITSDLSAHLVHRHLSV
ncbi:MAG TPA: urea ABC transporter ATP-binding subunit UrtE [Terriglobia bacterium]|nr:urea ABC transporter ATP-binding subunit UrtE [Terriglobia bacterium]